MPIYEFENPATKERREIVASMANSPPDRVCFLEGEHTGEWVPARDDAYAGLDVWTRVFSVAGVRGVEHGIEWRNGQPPISRNLPLDTRTGTVVDIQGHKLVKHSDGSLCDLRGRRLIRNRRDADNAAAMTGCRRD